MFIQKIEMITIDEIGIIGNLMINIDDSKSKYGVNLKLNFNQELREYNYKPPLYMYVVEDNLCEAITSLSNHLLKSLNYFNKDQLFIDNIINKINNLSIIKNLK